MYSVPKLIQQNSLKHSIIGGFHGILYTSLVWYTDNCFEQNLSFCVCKLNLHFIWSDGSHIYTVPQILCSKTKSVMSSLDIILVSDHCQKRLSIVHILSVLSLEVKITHHLTWIQTIQSIIIPSPPQTNTKTHSFCRWFLLHKQVLDTHA